MPEMTGSPRRTAAEILTLWPSATMITDTNENPDLYVVLKEWRDSLPDHIPYPSEDDLDGIDVDSWFEYQMCERRIPLYLATDEWMPVEVAERFGIRDTNWGIDYTPAEYLYPSEKRQEIEQALCDLGFALIRENLWADGPSLGRWRP
ncbi:hypothetical protein [Actinoallomurus soli]|uniref:hypothetical protein n=1 Tax=Actinoallomurus soli TaxID=2952535 RepID=UPI0020923292|nr:hypothetical protein [Actinoallomurus soli]MCO5967504.1 hypothetical protein [Actinoallomurus soli]